MGETPERIDVARQVQTVEWLKAELVSAAAAVLHTTRRGRDEQACDALAGVVMLSYLLGRRLGIAPGRLDQRLLTRLHAHLADGHELESWYGDLSALVDHFEARRVQR